MRQVFWSVGALLTAAAPAQAQAEPAGTRVFVIATGEEPACLQNAEVAAAIERHVTVQAQALLGPAPVPSGAVEVRVSGGVEMPLHIDIRGAGDGEVQTRDLDGIACPSIPDVVAAFVGTALAPAPRIDAPLLPDHALPGDTERVRLLAESMHPYTFGRYRAGHALLGLGIAGSAAMYLSISDRDSYADALVGGGTGLMVLAAIAGVAAPENGASNRFTEVAMAFGVSAMMAGTALSPSITDDGFNESYALVAAGWLATGLWQGHDAIYDPQPTIADLAPIRHKLRSPALRRRLTAGEIDDAELTFRRSRWRKRHLIPPMIGSIAAFAVAVREQDEHEQEAGMLFAGSSVAILFAMVLVPDPVARFERRLREAGVEVKPASIGSDGGGLVIGGRF